jgi:crossover junction endodeoxyribonuclease RusA
VSGVTLDLPEPPSANRWWRNVRGRMVTSAEARQYKADVLRLAVEQTRRPLSRARIAAPTPVRVTLVWFRGRKAGDLDKRIGVLMDALQGVCFENDSQVVELHATRIDRPRDAGVRVTVVGLTDEEAA